MSAIMNFIERNMEYIEIELIVAFLIDVNLLHKYTHGRDWLYICKKVNYDYCYENTDEFLASIIWEQNHLEVIY